MIVLRVWYIVVTYRMGTAYGAFGSWSSALTASEIEADSGTVPVKKSKMVATRTSDRPKARAK